MPTGIFFSAGSVQVTRSSENDDRDTDVLRLTIASPKESNDPD
jgi:hypothetical protein